MGLGTHNVGERPKEGKEWIKKLCGLHQTQGKNELAGEDPNFPRKRSSPLRKPWMKKCADWALVIGTRSARAEGGELSREYQEAPLKRGAKKRQQTGRVGTI